MKKDDMISEMVAFCFDGVDRAYYCSLNKMKPKKIIEEIYKLFLDHQQQELLITLLKSPVDKKDAAYGYRGGGRKKLPDEEKSIPFMIYGKKTDIEQIKKKAKSEGKSTSRYIFDIVLHSIY